MSTLPHSSHPVGPWSARFGRLFLFLGAALVASGLSGCGGGGGSSEPPPVAAPTLEIRSGLDGAATGPFQVDFDFSGDAAGFSQNSFTLAGGTVATGSFKQVTARHYTATIIPRDNSTGTVSLRVRSGAFTAVGGLLTNTVAYDFSKAYDTVKPQTEPTVNFSHVMQGASDKPPALVTLTFDIDVQPFTADALSVSSGTTVSAFTRVSARVYTMVLTPPAQTAGLMTVTVPEGAVIGAVPGGVANTRPYAYGVLYPSWPG